MNKPKDSDGPLPILKDLVGKFLTITSNRSNRTGVLIEVGDSHCVLQEQDKEWQEVWSHVVSIKNIDSISVKRPMTDEEKNANAAKKAPVTSWSWGFGP